MGSGYLDALGLFDVNSGLDGGIAGALHPGQSGGSQLHGWQTLDGIL